MCVYIYTFLLCQRGEGFSFDEDSNRDIPTEAAIEEEEDRLRDLQSAQKNMFLIIFQVHFIHFLKIHCFIIHRCY